MFIFARERETEWKQGRGRERDTHTELKAGSRLWAVSTEPDTGLKLTDHEIVTWAKIGRLTDWATQAPQGGWNSNMAAGFMGEGSKWSKVKAPDLLKPKLRYYHCISFYWLEAFAGVSVGE